MIPLLRCCEKRKPDLSVSSRVLSEDSIASDRSPTERNKHNRVAIAIAAGLISVP